MRILLKRVCSFNKCFVRSKEFPNILFNSFIGLSRITSRPTVQNELENHYIPRRAVLYVPGNDERKLDKIPKVEADCIVMDCEDGVALSKKEDARKTIHKYVQKKELFAGKDCSVRVNGIETDLFERDLEAVLAGPLLPTTLLLPKVESPDHVRQFSDKLDSICKGLGVREGQFRLILYVESAKALLGLEAICRSALKASEGSPFRLDGVVFGSDDFCADVGATRTSAASELVFARQWTLTVAKAFNLQAIDVVYIDFKDLSGLKRQSEEGAQFGFTGKQVIHPSQVGVVQQAFTPSEAKLAWASGLVAAFEKHQQEGKGAFTFEGSMIDRPLLLQAQNMLRLVENTKR